MSIKKKDSRTMTDADSRDSDITDESRPDSVNYPSRESITEKSISEYENNLIQLVRKVDKILTRKNAGHSLIGDNSLSVMYDNHENHAHFILNVLQLKDYELLRNTLPWVLHSYTARGFSPRYFREVLTAYKTAMHSTLSGQAADEISTLYDWMTDILPAVERQNAEHKKQTERAEKQGTAADQPDSNSNSNPNSKPQAQPHPQHPQTQPHPRTSPQTQMPASHYEGIVQTFTGYLLDGDYKNAHAVVSQELASVSIQDVYINIIQPAMYRVGDLWEEGKISVAHEHLATSIVMRLISYFYPEYVVRDPTKGRVLVTASVNEYHEVGARIVADLLEIDGWDVFYLGANTPPQDLLSIADEHQVFAVCISVTMSFNLNKVRELIQLIRNTLKNSAVKILAGGNAFSYSSHLKDEIDADACGSGALESLVILDRWYSERGAKQTDQAKQAEQKHD